jgi:hypothetical protein
MAQKELDAQRLIANLMSASAPREMYLQQGKPLTDLQMESLALTIEGLQTFLDVWRRKHGKKVQSGVKRSRLDTSL